MEAITIRSKTHKEPFSAVKLVEKHYNRMRLKQANSFPPILQFRLSVKDVKPEIWRKLLVSSDTTLERLHAILQVLMGWGDKHLYAFVINEKRYSPPNENDDDIGKHNSIKAKLSGLFTKKTEAITYEYDFGDGWQIDLFREPLSEEYQQKQTAECFEVLGTDQLKILAAHVDIWKSQRYMIIRNTDGIWRSGN